MTDTEKRIVKILKSTYEKCGTKNCPQEKTAVADTSDCATCDAQALVKKGLRFVSEKKKLKELIGRTTKAEKERIIKILQKMKPEDTDRDISYGTYDDISQALK